MATDTEIMLHDNHVIHVVGKAPENRPYVWIGWRDLNGETHYRTALDARHMNTLMRRWKKATEKKR